MHPDSDRSGILFAARIMHLRFLEAVIKPVHPCTGLIARFAQQNALLLRTTDIRVGTEKKYRRKKTAAAKRYKRKARCYILFFYGDRKQNAAVRRKRQKIRRNK